MCLSANEPLNFSTHNAAPCQCFSRHYAASQPSQAVSQSSSVTREEIHPESYTCLYVALIVIIIISREYSSCHCTYYYHLLGPHLQTSLAYSHSSPTLSSLLDGWRTQSHSFPIPSTSTIDQWRGAADKTDH